MALNPIMEKTEANQVNEELHLLVTQKEAINGEQLPALRRMSQDVYEWSALPADIRLSIQLLINYVRQMQQEKENNDNTNYSDNLVTWTAGYEDEIDSYFGESGKFKLYKIVSPSQGYMYSEWNDYYILTISQNDGTGLGVNIVQYRLSFDGVTKRTRQKISVNPVEFAWTEWEKDGGYTPQKGVDYWTDEDIAEIKSYVDEAILGGEW